MSASARPLPRVGGPTWDERRNTSRVFAIPPHAAKECRDALAALERNDPALVRWILDGHPNLTHEEHLSRFGEPYKGHRRRR